MSTLIYKFPWDVPVDQLSMKAEKKQAKNDPPQSDAIRTQILSNGRWRSTFSMPSNLFIDGNRLETFLLDVDGLSNRFKMPDFSKMYPNGAAKTLFKELASNIDFISGITGWTIGNAAASSRVTANYGLRLVCDGVHAPYATQSIAVAANTRYVARAYFQFLDLASATLALGTTAGASDIAVSAAVTYDNYVEVSFTSGANVNVFLSAVGAVGTAGQSCMVKLLSLHACPRVRGANQSTNILLLQDCPLSQNSLYQAGDMIEIASHLYQVKHDADSDAAGNASVLVWPLMKSPANLAPVISSIPCGVWMWPNDMMWSVKPANTIGVVGEAVEDLLS